MQTPSWEGSSRPSQHDGRNDRRGWDRDYRQYRRNTATGVIYVVPQYGYFSATLPGVNAHYVTPPPPTEVVTPREPEPPPAPLGVLRIEVEPRDALQIFVDGVYVGTPADLGDEIGLTPGIRRIELRARGYKPLTFNAEIVEDRAITYRGVLERDPSSVPVAPVAPVVVQPAAAPGSKTMYLIAKCYLGNVPPKAIELPPGCDISKLTTITP